PPQPGQLLALRRGQAVAVAGVDLGLAHPFADRGLGQIEVPAHLADRAVTALAQLDDLSLELRRERPARTTRLPVLAAGHDGHPLRGRTPDGGCPSNRGKPSVGWSRLERTRWV